KHLLPALPLPVRVRERAHREAALRHALVVSRERPQSAPIADDGESIAPRLARLYEPLQDAPVAHRPALAEVVDGGEERADLVHVSDAPPDEPVAHEVPLLDRDPIALARPGADLNARHLRRGEHLRLVDDGALVDVTLLAHLNRLLRERGEVVAPARGALHRDLDRHDEIVDRRRKPVALRHGRGKERVERDAPRWVDDRPSETSLD